MNQDEGAIRWQTALLVWAIASIAKSGVLRSLPRLYVVRSLESQLKSGRILAGYKGKTGRIAFVLGVEHGDDAISERDDRLA